MAVNIEIIERQDILQLIAASHENQRKDYIKKLVRQFRKQQGVKDAPSTNSGSPIVKPNIPSLFPGDAKGEWYFYNTAFR